jgi:hypothetical protein
MTITFENATDIVIENITVQRKFVDGNLSAYRLTANSGYVMHDKTENNTEFNPDTMEETPVIYYYRSATIAARYAPETWVNDWEAVLESSVDENYIFGGGNNPEHETM